MALAKNDDLTLIELADYVEQIHGLRVVPSSIWRLLDRHGMTYKKTAHTAEQQRPDVLRRRPAWFDAQIDLKPERWVFTDETGASTKMASVMDERLEASAARHLFLTDTGKP